MKKEIIKCVFCPALMKLISIDDCLDCEKMKGISENYIRCEFEKEELE